jgi:TolB-like protein
MIARPSRPVIALDSPVRRLSIAPASPRVRLFGAASIETPDGPLAGRAVQRHRVALVALLATTKRGARGRDHLIDLLWPDATAERGRRLLSDSIYRINRALGAEALATRGDSVELERAVLSSDVIDFDLAMRHHDWARVLDLYDAPFLDGFYLPGAVAFDQWMEVERRRFERAVDEARAAIATGARGIAVLPFRTIGIGGVRPELVDVLAEETIAAVARRTIIPVASGLSTLALRDTPLDVHDLGRRLNVAWIIDGTVRQAGDTLRLVARLTATDTGYQLWSESFDPAAHPSPGAEVSIAEMIADGVGARLRGRG